jgi:cytochrome c peroxidase
VVASVRSAPYAKLFLRVFGSNALADIPTAYGYIAEAIADFESTRVLNRFSSRYDQYLAGTGTLTAKELLGLQIYQGKAFCDACHPSRPRVATDGTVAPPLFTDFSYDNLGIPRSLNPLLAGNPIDYGLGARPEIAAIDPIELPDGVGGTVTVSEGQAGKFKVPTLRNIAKTPPYGHNGYFGTLAAIVNFYNTAGVPGLWPSPEVGLNLNRTELGALGLSATEVDALVAFLRTLTDQH